MRFAKYDYVVLTRDIPDKELRSGIRGTVLLVHGSDPDAYEVEFCDEAGRTVALVTVGAEHLALVQNGENSQW